MLGECLEKGDKALINIPQENREWGYNPVPNGTEVVIESFGEIDYGYINNYGHQPGIYQNRCWANVALPSGEVIHISTSMLDPLDNDAYQKKLEEHRDFVKSDKDKDRYRLRDLPETAFWIGDYVHSEARHCDGKMRIVGIKYLSIGEKRTDGSSMPTYDVSPDFPASWTTWVDDSCLSLIKRGNVWNYFHQQPTSFADLQEEADFFKMLGRVEQIRNPISGNYAWTKDEVLDAIGRGEVHSLSVTASLFGSRPITVAYKFLDEDLGRRVAEATLKGFGRR